MSNAKQLDSYQARAKRLTRIFGLCGGCGGDLEPGATNCEECETTELLIRSIEDAKARNRARPCALCDGGGRLWLTEQCPDCSGTGARK